MKKENESPEHRRAKQLIYEMGMLKVNDLHIYDDISLITDYYGFDKESFTSRFGKEAGVLIPGGTLVFEEVYMEDSLKDRLCIQSDDMIPDILGIIGNQHYAIEVVYKHDLSLADEAGRNKVAEYFYRNFNVIRIYVNNLEQINSGDIVGEWYMSQYAQECRRKIWAVTFPGLIKDASKTTKVCDYRTDRKVQCYRTKLESASSSTEAQNGKIRFINMESCAQKRSEFGKDGHKKAKTQICKYAIYADKMERVFTGKETACIHCYRFDNPITKDSSGRGGDWTTFPQFFATLKLEYLPSHNMFNRAFKEKYGDK